MNALLNADLTGQKFTRLLVVRPVASKGAVTAYECRCDCGAASVVTKYKLLSKHTKSCGCYSRSITAQRNTALAKHRMSGTPTYATWRAMVVRCTNPKSKYYASYGGRGIKVCDSWRSFDGFLRDMGKKPEGRSLDRIDNNGDYKPGNCRWATTVEQNQNKRTNVMLTHQGETLCAAEWARRVGMSKAGFYDRLNSGLSIEDAITKPNKKGKSWLKK